MVVMILGPPAVGKMTVGQELARRTGFKLLINHMIVDLVTEFIPFGSALFFDTVQALYADLLRGAAENGTDMIMTMSFRFDLVSARALLDERAEPFLSLGGQACFVELSAPLDVRLGRNETPNRRLHKKTDWATPEYLIALERDGGRRNSDGDPPHPERHLVIANEHVPAADAATMIIDRFGLPVAG